MVRRKVSEPPDTSSEPFELCDGLDNDGDGAIDEGLATVTLHADQDGDGFGDPENTIEACTLRDGWVLSSSDCDDLDPEIRPGADELCDDRDNDCDERIDEGTPADSWYSDVDGDGLGDDATVLVDCAAPDGMVAEGGDCDDSNPDRFPGAAELCDGLDDDCDDYLPWDETDPDGDGWLSCNGDCLPYNADAYLGAPELCDGWDDDCDGVEIDEDDDDGDGFRVCDGDCDDDAPSAYPGAPEELCDGLDNDCDGVIAAGEADSDGDGVLLCAGDCDDADVSRAPRALELCDGLDNDCDDEIDDDCVSCDISVPADHATVQAAIDAAVDGQRVCVGVGVWFERIDFGGKAIEVVGVGGPYGSVLDGGSTEYVTLGPVVTFATAETAASRLSGFTVQHGNEYGYGGGISIVGASPTLEDLVIRDNWAEFGGAGIYASDGDPTLVNSTASGNTITYYTDGWVVGNGGGVHVVGGSMTLDNVRVEGNTARDGGGVYVEDASLTATGTAMVGNLSYYAGCGAGLALYDAEGAFTNLLVASNVATKDYEGLYGRGGGLCLLNADSSATVANAVIANNSADGSGGGVYSAGTLTLTDALITGNYAPSGGGIFASGVIPTVRYSDVYANTSDDVSGMSDPVGTDGNVEVDPAVDDPTGTSAASWHLSAGSPLIDAGESSVLDPDGSTSDIGLYGGPSAAGLDHDFDGFPGWWLPGLYDASTSPGLDCDDDDPGVHE